MEEYPDELLRGILNNDTQWYKDGLIQPALFKFDHDECDGHLKMSINWYDDEGAMSELMNRLHADGNRNQFLGGVAIVPREDIDTMKDHKLHKGLISYERDALTDNKYHGNILVSAENDIRKKMLASRLASRATRMTREEWENRASN